MRAGALLHSFLTSCGSATFTGVDTTRDASANDATGDGTADARADADDDVCCPISVTHADAQDVLAFANAVRAFHAPCAPMCPGRHCAPAPTHDCDPNTSLCK
jgi:hypothetical protein